MKQLGLLFIVLGLIWGVIAFNMDTTVTTESQSIGSGEYSVEVPSMTVSNIGLIERRQNHLMFAGLSILVGVVLFGFGSLSGSRAATTPSGSLKPCPFCAEAIQPAAVKCRYCGSDLPDSFRAAFAPTPRRVIAATPSLKDQLLLVEQGKATFDDYSKILRTFGGNIEAKGFIVGMHYLITHNGKQCRVERFADLRQWFLDNISPSAVADA